MNGIQESQKSESAQSASRLTSISRERMTQEKVRELFDYRIDGVLIWKARISRRVKVGTEAGFFDKDGYLSIKIAGKTYKTHRIVWMWHYGYFPEHDIDHTNRKPSDNRIENLREVAHVCNSRNTRTYKTNTSGVKGVCWEKQRQKWAAFIVVDGRTIHLGRYADFLEACCHRLAAEQSLDWAGCDSCSPAYKYVRENIMMLPNRITYS